jgi:hypothetical protein
MNTRSNFQKYVILVVMILTTVASVLLGTRLYKNSVVSKNYKKDFFQVNKINYGLLNGDNWSWQLQEIIDNQVDTFRLSTRNKAVLREQISQIMNRLLTDIDQMLHEKREKTVDNIKYKVINTFVDINHFREEIPHFANTIIDELDKSKNREKMKHLLKEKVTDILVQDTVFAVSQRESIFRKYHIQGLYPFNAYIKKQTSDIEVHQRTLGYALVGLMALVLLLWIYVIKKRMTSIYSYAFLIAVTVSFINLFIGISLPMIEIDARISQVNLELLSSHIVFYDQIIFFQSKSILDVIMTLVSNGKVDTIFVGILILTFSVLFPFMKLVSATVYLFRPNKKNKFIKLMAFKSGKWSMADVMVVAIFMAYVGFQGILNDQLKNINITEDKVNLLSTNKSNLQIGFIIFVAFCLFNLFLSGILKRITAGAEKPDDETPKAIHS